jgi:perosamine synthetase
MTTRIVAALHSVLPDGGAALHEPRFGGNEWAYVRECLDSGWVSSVGSFVDRFERCLADFTGISHAVATVNGTAALQLCLQLAGVQRDDEVLIPALTFVATANAVSYCGAVPHLVDSDGLTLGIDPAKLGDHLADISVQRNNCCFNRFSGRRIRVVVAMHTFGHPVDLDSLLEVCHRHHLELVEDAAESLGSYYKGHHTGSYGCCAALSFNGNKTVTTGGGGAILTNDEKRARLAKHLTTTAREPHRWEYFHDMTGYNFRMPNINAALGCAQLEQLPVFLGSKRRLAGCYKAAFEGVEGVQFFVEPWFASSNYWLNTLLLNEDMTGERDAILAATNDAGIITRPAWAPMHRLPMYRNCPRMGLETVESLERRLINIPSSVVLGERHGS